MLRLIAALRPLLVSAVFLAGVLLAPALHASPIVWTVDETLRSGGAITGTFTYDSGTITTWSLTAYSKAVGSSLPGIPGFANPCPMDPSNSFLSGPYYNAPQTIYFTFVSTLPYPIDTPSASISCLVSPLGLYGPMWDLSHPLSYVPLSDIEYSGYSYWEWLSPSYMFGILLSDPASSGYISSVPIPAGLFLLGSGLIGLSGIGLRKRWMK